MTEDKNMRAPLEAAEIEARRLGGLIARVMPRGWGFVLLLSTIGREGFSTWIGTHDRLTTVRLLEEFAQTIAKTEGLDRTAEMCWLCDSTAQPLITLRGPKRSVVICSRCVLSKENLT